jgi:hypothetical protein
MHSAFGEDKGVIYQKLDTIIFHRYIHSLESKKQSSVGDLMVQTAVYLMDSPYAGKTLEVCGKNERLVVNLRQFDCVTLVESCLALVHTLKSKDQSFEAYCTELKTIRYRNGILTDYSSRLHYFTEWIGNNETKAKVINLTPGFGGKSMLLTLDYMSHNTGLYPPMSNPEIHSEIKDVEKNISNRMYFYIPKNAAINSKIRNGDILCLTSKVPGIGISHVGIAFRLGGVLYLLHASQTGQKVEITSEPYANYILQLDNVTGYMVVRPL